MSANEIPMSLSDPNFLSLPAAAPPPGIIPNFENPEDRGPILVKVGGVLVGLMMVFVINRVYVKIWVVRKAWWDDLTVCLSTLGAILFYILVVWGRKSAPQSMS